MKTLYDIVANMLYEPQQPKMATKDYISQELKNHMQEYWKNSKSSNPLLSQLKI